MSTLRVPKSEWHDQDDPGLETWLVNGNWKDFPPNSIDRRTVKYRRGHLAISQGNPWQRLGLTLEQIGGDFRVYKKNMTEYSSLGTGQHDFSYSTDPLQDGMEHWRAPQTCVGPNISDGDGGYWKSPSPTSFLELDALGTTAISRILPTASSFDLATFAGEILGEGLPRASIESWKRRTGAARSAGSDYLNAEFGWKPLVGDIQRFARTVKNAEAILDQFIADSGRLVHRRYDWPEEQETSREEYPGYLPVPRLIDALDLPNCSDARLVQRTTTTTKRWLEATFVYVLPPVGSLARKQRLADKLLGVQLTPEVVWELTPWSWAIDWVTNLGDILTNLSAFLMDGLVMPYAYIMEHRKVVNDYVLSGISYDTYPGRHVFRQTFTSEVKQRRVATPFGFGLNLEDFTPRQKAILVALAASKGSGKGTRYE